MRFFYLFAVAAVAGCAGNAERAAPMAERQVPIDATNIVEVQKAGYKIVNEDGRTLYCKRDLNTGSHVRKTTTCLTEQEWTQMIDASRRGVEAMRRERLPKQDTK
jgi:hypothetical protein